MQQTPFCPFHMLLISFPLFGLMHVKCFSRNQEHRTGSCRKHFSSCHGYNIPAVLHTAEKDELSVLMVYFFFLSPFWTGIIFWSYSIKEIIGKSNIVIKCNRWFIAGLALYNCWLNRKSNGFNKLCLAFT